MQKIILFYLFTSLKDTKSVMLWQKSLASGQLLKGRIIISKDGINGNLGGDIKNLKYYIKETKSYDSFNKIIFKWNEGGSKDFPKLSVKIRPELVSFNAVKEIKVNKKGIINGAQHLKPDQLHDLLKDSKRQFVFFDGRNNYESKIGRFKNAITPNTRTSKDFIPILESGKYDNLKDKAIITYCTAGIRCEILSSIMKKRGFKYVYQLDGGIIKYLEKYPSSDLWEGSVFVFDQRLGIKYDPNKKDIGKCIHCKNLTSNYLNCDLKSCNELVLICDQCSDNPLNLYHSKICYKLAQKETVS